MYGSDIAPDQQALNSLHMGSQHAKSQVLMTCGQVKYGVGLYSPLDRPVEWTAWAQCRLLCMHATLYSSGLGGKGV